MTDPMELVGRLEAKNAPGHINIIDSDTTEELLDLLTEAAACIREVVEFIQSVADVPIEREDLNCTITNIRFGRGALAKETKTEAITAVGTLRDILTAARRRVHLPPAPGAEDE